MASEKEQWKELYEYVKTYIMGYDQNQVLTKDMIFRLKGMKSGKYMANSAVESLANYPYDIILLTYKYVYPRIEYKLIENSFNDDMHRFNYVAKIVSDNLNLVYNKVKKKREEDKRIEDIKVTDIPNYANIYVNKDNKDIDKNLEGFW